MSKIISKLGKVHAFGEPCKGWLICNCIYIFSSTARKRVIIDINLTELE